jgi:hypothetical protein
MAAKESTLSEIHELHAQLLLRKLKLSLASGEPLSPSEEAQVTKFLKDNSITADLEKDDSLIELTKAAEKINSYPFKVDEDSHTTH